MNGQLRQVLQRFDRFDLERSMVLMGYVGSLAHGTYVPSSDPTSIDDKDVMGIFVPPESYFLGLDHFEGKQYQEGEWDVTVYEIRKYIRMLLNCNPNVLSLLWLEENDYLIRTPAGRLLLENRDIFVSKAAYKSFCGYASGQLKRMTRLGDESKAYQGARRRKRFEKFGFDCKNAAHLIRILRMGIEFLVEGKLYVKRHDSQELIRIKQGDYSLAKIERMADEHFRMAQDAHIRSTIPNEPDRLRAGELTIEIARAILYGDDKPTR